jgi:hypothetical protein
LLIIFELIARPNATLSSAIRNRNRNATTTSIAVTPPNRNGRAPTGASTTTYMPIAVYAARNFPRAISPGGMPVRSTASQVRPSRSEAMLFAATAGPISVTTKYAIEKKTWKITTPVFAGAASVETMPPIEAISSVIRIVTTVSRSGVRVRRAACFSSRIQIGFGSLFSRSTRNRARSTSLCDTGPPGDVVPVCALTAPLPA